MKIGIKLPIMLAVFLLLFTNSIAAPPPFCIQQPGLQECKNFCNGNPDDSFCKNFYPEEGASQIPATQNKDWIYLNVLALLVATLLLVALFMIGHSFNLPDLKFLATEEFYQLIITAIILGSFTSIIAFGDSVSKGLSPDTSLSLNDNALSIVNKNLEISNVINSQLLSSSDNIGSESSKAAFCSFISISININACGSFRMLLQPYSLAFQIIATGIAELSSLKSLLIFSRDWALVLFLPFGLFLRNFQFTRGAGGLLIAFAICAYLILPASVVFMDSMVSSFVKSNPELNEDNLKSSKITQAYCNEWLAEGEDNASNAVSILDDLVDKQIGVYMFYFLIKVNLVLISAILSLITSLRFLSGLAGAEVDLSAISRLV